MKQGFASGKVDPEAFQCPEFENGGAPRTNPGPDPGNWELAYEQVDSQGDRNPNSLEDKQAPRMAYTANAAIIPRNKFSTVLPRGPRINRLVRENEIDTTRSVILATELHKNWAATDDVRYFADGLALETGRSGPLNRKQGFLLVDLAWLALTGGADNNFFDTQLVTNCKDYQPGDSRGDIAGNQTTPGASPVGADGIIDGKDIQYVYANFGDWSNIDDSVYIDLSADLNGDLQVNQADATELATVILGTYVGDLDWDCDVDLSDLAALLGCYGQTGDLSYEEGDINGNGRVGLSDLAALLGNYGS